MHIVSLIPCTVTGRMAIVPGPCEGQYFVSTITIVGTDDQNRLPSNP